MATFAFIGFGELGSSLAEGLSRSGAHIVRAYTRQRPEPAVAAKLEERLRRASAHRCDSLEQALAGATAVVSVVPASASRVMAERCAPLLDPEAYYVDLSSARVAVKQEGAELVSEAGARYVDGAVLGTVATSGFGVPIVASGPGARGFAALVESEGLLVEVLDAPVGHATLLKLLRSVYMKGRDALIVEMMLTARHYGLERQVAESIKGPGEEVPFSALAERVLCALAVHSERRAEELAASSEVVRAAGVEPSMTSAGVEVLRHLSELELRAHFDRERPANADDVLARIESLASQRERSA